MVGQQGPVSAGADFSARLIAADGTSYELTGEQTLGRSADADITISHPKISRSHARFRILGRQLTVEDLGSANGTRVNQRRIEGPTQLADGDVVSFDTVELSVVLTGLADDADATVVSIGDDATVVSAIPDSAPQVVPEQAPDSETPPVAARAVEPEPATPEPLSSSAPQTDRRPATVPGAWRPDEDPGDHTVVWRPDSSELPRPARPPIPNVSDLPHLIVNPASDSQQIVELETVGGDEADVWEIGRDENCEIAIPEETVGARHAQLIHQNGRWKLVKLPSANAIYVNNEKRLTAFLDDDDEIRLGKATLIFKSGGGSAADPKSGRSGQGEGSTGGKLARFSLLGFIVVVVTIALWWYLR